MKKKKQLGDPFEGIRSNNFDDKIGRQGGKTTNREDATKTYNVQEENDDDPRKRLGGREDE